MEKMLPSVLGATHASLVKGNKIEVLENGAFFEALKEALRGAKKAICFETFLWKPGRLSAELVEILCERARADVAVRILLDGSGGKISKEEKKKLIEADCKVAFFHPPRFSNMGILNNRDHRKIVVVDGSIGFVGGHCIVDDWLGNAEDKKHFRDVSVRAEGPIVGELQSAFLENWCEETGEVLLGERFFPELEKRGDIAAHVVYVSPAGSSSSIEMLHYVAIHVAGKSIHIQNPYFVPDPEMIRALTEAVKRGVEVSVMLPSAEASDSPMVQHASHHRFGEMLKGGVRIFEYKRTLLHMKVMTIDGCWTSVGSTNFDDRSFELNDEVTMGIVDETIARQFQEMFQRDLKHCSEYTLEQWKKRGPLHKLKDFAFFAMNEQL
jgi:cardiolipin synthase